MSLPDEIDGHRVVLNSSYKFDDRIDAAPDTPLSGGWYQKLTRTELECRTITKEGRFLDITFSSSIYPSANEAETIKDKDLKARPAALYVDIKQLDYYFGLGIDGGVYIQWKEGSRHKQMEAEELSIKQIKVLQEVMDLVESRGTEFFPKPYTIVQEN